MEDSSHTVFSVPQRLLSPQSLALLPPFLARTCHYSQPSLLAARLAPSPPCLFPFKLIPFQLFETMPYSLIQAVLQLSILLPQ